MAERADDPARPFNTSVLVAPDGSIAARYRKMHLFDVENGPAQSRLRGSVESHRPRDTSA